MVEDVGGISSLLNVISCSEKFPSTPAILALGHIASMSPSLASAVIQSKVFRYIHFNGSNLIYCTRVPLVPLNRLWFIGVDTFFHSFEQ